MEGGVLTGAGIGSGIEVPELRPVANEKGEQWVLAGGVGGCGEEAIEFIGVLAVSESEVGASYSGVAHYITSRRPFHVDMVNSFHAER